MSLALITCDVGKMISHLQSLRLKVLEVDEALIEVDAVTAWLTEVNRERIIGSAKYYIDRLDDLTLLKRTVVLSTGLLAVPVGGKRKRGGEEWGRQCDYDLLASRPAEFPDLRIAESAHLSSLPEYPLMLWGVETVDRAIVAESGENPDRFFGEKYGYSENAIDEFINPKRFESHEYRGLDLFRPEMIRRGQLSLERIAEAERWLLEANGFEVN